MLHSAICLSSQSFQSSFFNWWKWHNVVLILRIFATVRNCGLLPRLKEDTAQRIPKAERETYKQTISFNRSDWAFESIRLVSDDDKAGGKHCTIWAVTACDFTSQRQLLYSPAKSNGVYSSPAADQHDCAEHTDPDEFKTTVTNLIHLDTHTSFCLTQTFVVCSDSVYYLLLILL